MESKRVALYCRVSTADQTASMQESELRSYCERRHWAVVEVYQDVMSGAKDRRPALTRLMVDARRGRFQVVAVYRLDRLGRSLKHLLVTLDELHEHQVSFFSLSEQLDFTSPAGEFMFSVLGAVSQFERAIIRQRVRSGVAEAKRKGKHCGRPRIVVDAGRIDSMRQAGMSWSQIAAGLGRKVGAIRTAHKRYAALQEVLESVVPLAAPSQAA